MKLYLWATYINEYMSTLMLQLEAAEVEFEVPPLGTATWGREGNGWADRMRGFHEWVCKQKGIVGFIDPWDHLFFGTREELEEKYTNLNDKDVVWGLERVCWPPLVGVDWGHRENAPLFPPTPTPYKYPNGGGILGPAEIFQEVFDPAKIPGFGLNNYDKDLAKHPRGKQEWMDQVYFQDLYKKGLGVGDYNCKIFQNLIQRNEGDFRVEGKRVINTLTGETPMFFHANGKTAFPREVMEVLFK